MLDSQSLVSDAERQDTMPNCSGATMVKPGYLSRCSVSFVNGMETAFYRYGRTVGSHPCVCIIASILLVIVCASGLVNFHLETRRDKLWIPPGSRGLRDKNRMEHYFPTKQRIETLLIEADNVLDPKVLQTMLNIDKRIKNITIQGEDWKSLCFRRKTQCYSASLLELWSFNEAVIANLTQADIIKKINKKNLISPVTLSLLEINALIGEVKRDINRLIVGAKATTMTYALKDKSLYDKRRGLQVDVIRDAWEDEYLTIAKMNYSDETATIYRYASKSYSDEAYAAIGADYGFLPAAYVIVAVYVILATSSFSFIEHKVYVAVAGILTVGFSTVASMGLAAAFNCFYDNLHSVLPFLLLGIGVDDMFVIIASWNNLSHDQKQFQVREQAGLTLKQAGVSIAVTSITDLCAFSIGSTTILPSLRSFCIHCVIGVIFLFLFSTTFFVACLTIDRRRYESRRDACCCCYKYRENYKQSEWGQTRMMKELVKDAYAPFLLRLPVKISVLAVTVLLLSICAWGTVTWEQDFDIRRFLLSDSYLKAYMDKTEEYFPSEGVEIAVYLEDVDYYKERDALNRLYRDVKRNNYVQEDSIKCWYYEFQDWIRLHRKHHVSLNTDYWPTKESLFYAWLAAFLTGEGQQYLDDIVFKNQTTPLPLASRFIRANQELSWNTNEEILAMTSLRHVTSTTNLENSDAAFVFSERYLYYEVNRIIRTELLRNLSLAATCIFITVCVLLANVWASVLVFLCVIIVLVDIAGTLNFMGLTIDTVVSIPVILSVGLSVDYSVHICHAFMVLSGSRDARMKRALVDKGVAVFNGGIGTLLAFILLTFSRSYVFTTFFKVFLLVVFYGLFHGLVVLPVLLSLLGPVSYPSAQPADPVDYEKIVLNQNVRRRFFRERRCYSL